MSKGSLYRQRFEKTVLIFLFLFLSVALIVTWNTPTTGYEASIYQSTPLILWASLTLSMVTGITLVAVSIAKHELSQDLFWKIGLLLMVLCYTICLSLFIIRGYYMWGMVADPGTHFGWINDTLNAGCISNDVFYPIVHIYLPEIFFITGLNLVYLHKLVPILFSVLCVLFMYVVSRSLFSQPGALLTAAISCCLPFYGFYWYLDLSPNNLANLFLPIALFLTIRYLQRKTFSWGISFIVVIILSPLFHPLLAVILGLTFLTLWIPTRLPYIQRSLRERNLKSLMVDCEYLKLVLPLLILLSWFIFWISSFSMWDRSILDLYNTISLEGKLSQGLALKEQILYANMYGYNVIEFIIKRFGSSIVLIFLSMMSLPLLWNDFFHRRHNGYLFSLFGPLVAVTLLLSALLMFNLPFGPIRFMMYIQMFGTFFAAYFFLNILTGVREKPLLKKPTLRVTCVVSVMFYLFVAGVLILYPSPYNLDMDRQTTQSEVLGMKNFFEHRDVTMSISGIRLTWGRFSYVLLSPEERIIQGIPMYPYEYQAPWHFGYDTYPSMSLVYDEEVDLIITQRDKQLYVDYFPDMAKIRFTSQDFKQLDSDPGMNFIYVNGEFELWRIT